MSTLVRRGLLELLTIRCLVRPGQRQITTLTRKRNFTSKMLLSARTGQAPELLTKVRYFASEKDKIRTVRQKLWKYLRVLFMLTGGIVWGTPVVLYIGIKTRLIKVEVEEENETESRKDDEHLFSIFDVSKDDEQDHRAREISEKASALMKIWNKLKLEDGVLRKFGEPVNMIGYRGKSWVVYKTHIFDSNHHFSNTNNESQNFDTATEIDTDEMTKKTAIDWCVACVVAGPKLAGILEMEFSKVNSEWVPTSLRLEGLQKTGEVICDVSGPLPNGVTRFTRLSND